MFFSLFRNPVFVGILMTAACCLGVEVTDYGLRLASQKDLTSFEMYLAKFSGHAVTCVITTILATIGLYARNHTSKSDPIIDNSFR